jgi:drug/metabolite transporter (DMT)-like permease
MQKLHFAKVLAHYQLIAGSIMLFALVVETLIMWQPMRIFTTYSWQVWMLMLAASLANSFGLQFNTVANQNERPGFIMIIGYIGIVYAFLGDIFIFDSTFNTIALIGVTITFICTAFLMVYKLWFKAS